MEEESFSNESLLKFVTPFTMSLIGKYTLSTWSVTVYAVKHMVIWHLFYVSLQLSQMEAKQPI